MSEWRDIESGEQAGESGGRAGRNLIAVIGIDRYQHWRRLGNAVRDASGALTLFQQLGFEHATVPLLDERATGMAMRALVTHQLRGLSPDDNLVLFYAGHGATQQHRLGGEVIKTGYLVPVDAEEEVFTWIDLEGWLRAVALLPAKHILVILDACHSGIALDPIIKWRDRSTWRDEPLATLKARRSRRVITSALDDQLALDNGPLHGHSLFTGCLIEGLRHELRRRGSPVTTGSELGLYVQKRVESYPHSRQTPDFGTFAFDDRGEMVIPLAIEPRENESAIVETEEHGDTVPHATAPQIAAPQVDQLQVSARRTGSDTGVDYRNSVTTSARRNEVITSLRTAGLRLFFLIGVLVFGIVALLLFTSGECNAASKMVDVSAGASGAKPEPVMVMLPPPELDGSAGSGSSERTAFEPLARLLYLLTGAGSADAHWRPPVRPAPVRRSALQTATAVDDKDVRFITQLAKQAASLEKARRWSEARAIYQKLEKTKGYSAGEALYHQAWNAFQSNAISDAAQLAADAVRQGGPFKTSAYVLYGDALFRQSEYARAKNIYLGIRKSLHGEEHAETIKKIAACNKMLKLPEADGIDD